MKYLILFLITFSAYALTDSEYEELLERMQKDNATSIYFNTPTNLVASKCRLKLPVNRQECIAAGIHPSRAKGGMLKGLPVTNGNTMNYYNSYKE